MSFLRSSLVLSLLHRTLHLPSEPVAGHHLGDSSNSLYTVGSSPRRYRRALVHILPLLAFSDTCFLRSLAVLVEHFRNIDGYSIIGIAALMEHVFYSMTSTGDSDGRAF